MQTIFLCRKTQDRVGRCGQFQDEAIFKMVLPEMHIAQQTQQFQRHRQTQPLEWLFQRHQIPHSINNKINWMNSCCTTINSYYQCESRMVQHSQLAAQLLDHLAMINPRIWTTGCRKYKITFESQRHSLTRSMRKRYDTVSPYYTHSITSSPLTSNPCLSWSTIIFHWTMTYSCIAWDVTATARTSSNEHAQCDEFEKIAHEKNRLLKIDAAVMKIECDGTNHIEFTHIQRLSAKADSQMTVYRSKCRDFSFSSQVSFLV